MRMATRPRQQGPTRANVQHRGPRQAVVLQEAESFSMHVRGTDGLTIPDRDWMVLPDAGADQGACVMQCHCHNRRL